jgi:hypothetical protein
MHMRYIVIWSWDQENNIWSLWYFCIFDTIVYLWIHIVHSQYNTNNIYSYNFTFLEYMRVRYKNGPTQVVFFFPHVPKKLTWMKVNWENVLGLTHTIRENVQGQAIVLVFGCMLYLIWGLSWVGQSCSNTTL